MSVLKRRAQSGEPKNKQITVRFTEKEFELLVEAASITRYSPACMLAELGIKRSHYIIDRHKKGSKGD